MPRDLTCPLLALGCVACGSHDRWDARMHICLKDDCAWWFIPVRPFPVEGKCCPEYRECPEDGHCAILEIAAKECGE